MCCCGSKISNNSRSCGCNSSKRATIMRHTATNTVGTARGAARTPAPGRDVRSSSENTKSLTQGSCGNKQQHLRSQRVQFYVKHVTAPCLFHGARLVPRCIGHSIMNFHKSCFTWVTGGDGLIKIPCWLKKLSLQNIWMCTAVQTASNKSADRESVPCEGNQHLTSCCSLCLTWASTKALDFGLDLC